MSNHTPGPWTMFRTEDGAIGVVGSNNTDVALCRKSNGWPMDSSRSLDEDDANARLIAAAPELLAVSHAIKMARDMGIPSSEILDPKGEVGKALDVAIAKATGGAQ